MQYTPTFVEFFVLLFTDVVLCGAGVLVFRYWKRRDLTPPVFVVLAMTAIVLGCYLGVTRYLWLRADPRMDDPIRDRIAHGLDNGAVDGEKGPTWISLQGFAVPPKEGEPSEPIQEAEPSRVLVVLAWCFLFWTIPVAYYSPVLVNSITVRRFHNSSWTELEIPDPTQFDEVEGYHAARELALMGDVEHAVDDEYSYSRKRIKGCLAAARLLESDGRYEEAADLFREIVNQVHEDGRAWTEAMYHLGRILQKRLNRQSEAISLFNELVMRAPESEYGRLAFKALRTMNPGGDPLLDTLDAAFDWSIASPDPSAAAEAEAVPAGNVRGSDTRTEAI